MRLPLLLATLSTLGGCAVIGPTTVVDFEQGGYPDGGVLTGRFTGQDLDQDGKIRFDADVDNEQPEMFTFFARYQSTSSTIEFGEDDLRTLTWSNGADVIGASGDGQDGLSAINGNDTGLTISGPGLPECGAGGVCGSVTIPGRTPFTTTFIAQRTQL
ncbi:MAG: hypothetical protein AAFQ51_09130 [Pseudomonadota bacterium]